MLFPPGKTKMWTQCIVCLKGFFFFCCHVLFNRERVLLGIGKKVCYFCALWDYKFYLNVHFLTKKMSGISGVCFRFLTI